MDKQAFFISKLSPEEKKKFDATTKRIGIAEATKEYFDTSKSNAATQVRDSWDKQKMAFDTGFYKRAAELGLDLPNVQQALSAIPAPTPIGQRHGNMEMLTNPATSLVSQRALNFQEQLPSPVTTKGAVSSGLESIVRSAFPAWNPHDKAQFTGTDPRKGLGLSRPVSGKNF